MNNEQLRTFIIEQSVALGDDYGLMSLSPADGMPLPEIKPGQFVEIDTGARGVLLRRPISVCDIRGNHLLLLVRNAGTGTKALLEMPEGTEVSLILPLGNGFTMLKPGEKGLLVGGGVGVAPLLYYGRQLTATGCRVSFLLGARNAGGLLLLDQFRAIGDVYVTTEDGSQGIKGLVTQHPALLDHADLIAVCGPAPMMKAVAAVARRIGRPCEASLENMMACGLGACLCCVEKTVRGNVCVCKEGPVFNINQLTW